MTQAEYEALVPGSKVIWEKEIRGTVLDWTEGVNEYLPPMPRIVYENSSDRYHLSLQDALHFVEVEL